MPQVMGMHWIFRDDMSVIDGIIMKSKHAVILEVLKTQVLDHLHLNHIEMKKNKGLGM